ncbi:homeobox protein B-H2-like [Drosophila hydei]|uniref:Homeobox protein B-H2-like n=1 Tax=Drosophila hydei TaxID=7224 RepID=A0A6J1M8U3_DROHY|nr:homeobox protein B-H2-like [Drosophila hydei]
MDAYNKYHKGYHSYATTQTNASPLHNEHKHRKQLDQYAVSNPKESMQGMLKSTQPKELQQKATQTCLRHNHQKQKQKQQQQQRHHQQQQHQHQHQKMEAQLNRDANRLKIDPRLRYEKSKSFFNIDHVPQSKGTYRLPPLPSDGKPDREGADGDYLLYKNLRFGKDSAHAHGDHGDHSDHSDHSEQQLSIPLDQSPRKPNASLSMFESAREHCRLTKEQFSAKYGVTESGSSNSARTVITTKSGENLRTVVQSQIEMQELLQKSISKIMMLPSLGLSEETDCTQVEHRKNYKIPESVSKDNSVSIHVQTDKSSFNFCVEDIVSSKVIAPMMRRVQRMYLNNLQEEMKLMEDLERVPCLVGELYRSADLTFGPSEDKKNTKDKF